VSNAEAEPAKLVAEREAEYMRLISESFDTPAERDFYEFVLALDALEASLSGGEKTVILDAAFPVAQALLGN